MNASPRQRSKLVRIAVWVIGILVFIEVTLQVLAYVAWTQRRSGETRSEGDGPVVLCVGDSMTFGLGSTPGGSYPAQLEAELRARDERSWVVVNGGYPGRNSHDVLELLPSQLETFQPDHVCVLVGTNDWWSRPEADTDAGDADGFPIVWRTGRLIDILFVGRLAEHGEAEFVGTWHKDGVEVHFQPTGRLLYAGAELRWTSRAGQLVVTMPDQEEVVVDWQLDGDTLTLESSVWEEPQVLARGPVQDVTPLQEGRRAAARGDLDAAIASFERAIAEGKDRWLAEEGRFAALLARGDEAEARRALNGFVTDPDVAARDRAACEAVTHAHAALGEIDAALTAADRLVAAHPESDRGWEILIKHAPPRGEEKRVIDAIDRAIPMLPEGHEYRVNLRLQRALLVKATDPIAFCRDLFEALQAGAREELVVNHIHLARDVVDTATCDTALERLGADAEAARRFRTLFERGLATGDDVFGVIVEHITAILDLCREHGAEPLLLDYPFRDLDHERLMDTIATSRGVTRVPLRPTFDELLESLSRDDLFIRDDVHCNDRGYGVMADLVADELLP